MLVDGIYQDGKEYEGTFIWKFDKEDEHGFSGKEVCFKEGKQI